MRYEWTLEEWDLQSFEVHQMRIGRRWSPGYDSGMKVAEFLENVIFRDAMGFSGATVGAIEFWFLRGSLSPAAFFCVNTILLKRFGHVLVPRTKPSIPTKYLFGYE